MSQFTYDQTELEREVDYVNQREYASTLYEKGTDRRIILKTKDIWDSGIKQFLNNFVKNYSTDYSLLIELIDDKSPIHLADNIFERDNLQDLKDMHLVWVLDASDDPDVDYGAALYLVRRDYQDNITFEKLAKSETFSSDPVVIWDKIEGKPSNSVKELDEAVELKHSHNNTSVLDKLGEQNDMLTFDNKAITVEGQHIHNNITVLSKLGEQNDKLTYNGNAISAESTGVDETGIAYGSTIDNANTYTGKLKIILEQEVNL